MTPGHRCDNHLCFVGHSVPAFFRLSTDPGDPSAARDDRWNGHIPL